ncbi:MAG TPA: hypothetical protein VI260_16115 [Blastocatellia bacterium]|jgi:AAA+ ATPase superfamily predicted ATPase
MEKIFANPFQAGGRLRNPEHFVGRESELRQILSCVANMDSVSVVGPRRIGKSSLLHHIVATGQQRLNQSYRFHYLDLQPLCSAEEFYNRACEAIAGKPGSSYDDLETAIDGNKIVLCLDEFEQSVKADFGAEFFHALRSLAQTGNLALVIATKAALSQVILRYENPLVSPFFNVFTTVKLGELTEADARALVAKSDRFNREETDFILRLAGAHPYWLSFVSLRLYYAKQEARSGGGAVDFNRIERLFEDEFNGAAANNAVAANQTQQNATTEGRAVQGSSGAIITSLLLLLAGVLFAKLSVNILAPIAGFLVSGGLILIGLMLFLFRGVNWIGGTR